MIIGRTSRASDHGRVARPSGAIDMPVKGASLETSGVEQRTDARRVAQGADAPDRAPHLVGAGAIAIRRKAHRLVLDLGAAEGVARVALRLVDAGLGGLPVPRLHLDLADPARRVRRIDFGVAAHDDPLAERDDGGVAPVRVEIGQPGTAMHGDEAEHGADRAPDRARRWRPGAPVRSPRPRSRPSDRTSASTLAARRPPGGYGGTTHGT